MWKLRGMVGMWGLVAMTWMSGVAWGQPLEEAPREEQDLAKERLWYKDNASDPTRVILGSTALPRQERTWNWQSLYAGLHQFDYQVNRNVNLGLSTVLPIGVVGAMGHISVYGQVSPLIHVGFKGQAGIGTAFIAPAGGILLGGGPMVTIGNKDIYLNIHVPMYGLIGLQYTSYGSPHYNDSSYSGVSTPVATPPLFVAIPNIGFSARLTRVVRFNVEMHVPLSPAFGNDAYGLNGRLWLIQYGIRISGRHLYGDIFFSIPIAPGSEHVLMYSPLGIPGFTLGYKF